MFGATLELLQMGKGYRVIGEINSSLAVFVKLFLPWRSFALRVDVFNL